MTTTPADIPSQVPTRTQQRRRTPPRDLATRLRQWMAAPRATDERTRMRLRWMLRGALLGAELGAIALLLLVFSAEVWRLSPDFMPEGSEYSFLANSGIIAGDFFHEFGKIPLWNPLLGRGEPLVEGSFSFILNPFMSVPFLAFDGVQAGKLVLFIHMLIMAYGGWALGNSLELRAPGRLVLALLLGASGSFTAALSQFQMGVSQAYMPWVFAGLFGTLYRKERYHVGLLAISALLLLSAGTFWYVLPTAISCVVLVAFAIYGRSADLKQHMAARLLLATAFTLLLSMARLLPQIDLHAHLVHPESRLSVTFPFMEMAGNYTSDVVVRGPDHYLNNIYFHYIIPPLFGGVILLAWLLIHRHPKLPAANWRVVVPAALLIVFYTAWAQENTPLVAWLYERVSLLSEWRFLGRMMAASSLWIAVLIAIAVDDLLVVLALPRRRTVARAAGIAGALLVVLLTTQAVASVLENWRRIGGTVPVRSITGPALFFLRQQQPGELVSVFTTNYSDYLPFYDLRTRGEYSNPDYTVDGSPPTIGSPQFGHYPPRYALTFVPALQREAFSEMGYRPYNAEYGETLWINESTPNYAYLVSYYTATNRNWPLTRRETRPVRAYAHHMDSITVQVDGHFASDLVVVHEVAYPGWHATLNGEPVQLESVGNLMGVRLPHPDSVEGPLTIRFEYVPHWFYRGAGMTIFGALLLALYLLRIVGRRY